MYLAPVNFYLPHDLIWQIHSENTVSFEESDNKVRNPIYKQLIKMVIKNIQLEHAVELVDQHRNETLLLTPELLSKIKYRHKSNYKALNENIAVFREQTLSQKIQQSVLPYLPDSLQKLNPIVALQGKSATGGMVGPHKDHHRTALLFFLLEGNNEETIWWEKTEDFEEFDFFRFPEVIKLKKAYSEIIKKHQWYVFNSAEYHSVHSTKVEGIRTALCIEFDHLSVDDLYFLLTNN